MLKHVSLFHVRISVKCKSVLSSLRCAQCRSFSATRLVADDALRNAFGAEKRNLLHAKGTLLRLQDHGRFGVQVEPAHELRKLALCKRYNLQPRDLGALEPDVPGRRAQIFVRPGAIVYSVFHRAVIQADKLLIVEKSDEASSENAETTETTQTPPEACSENAMTIRTEMYNVMVRDKLTVTEREPGLTPFEFIALEALLAQTYRSLHRITAELQDRFTHLLKKFSDNEAIPTSALQDMLEIKDAAEALRDNTEDFKNAVSEVLREESDMAAMYLTDLSQGKQRQIGDDDEIELLLETYRHHASSLAATASTLLSRLASINSHVALLLSATRNRLLNLEITIAFTTLGVSIAGFLGAIFGMNLPSGFENTPHLFYYTAAVAVLMGFITVRTGRRALLKARSVKSDQYSVLQRPLRDRHAIVAEAKP